METEEIEEEGTKDEIRLRLPDIWDEAPESRIQEGEEEATRALPVEVGITCEAEAELSLAGKQHIHHQKV